MSVQLYGDDKSRSSLLRKDDGYIRLGNILDLSKFHFPRTFEDFIQVHDRPQGPESCRIVFGKNINHFRFTGDEMWSDYSDIKEAFDHHQIHSHNRPYSWDLISAPVKVVISYQGRPIKAVLTYERVFPQRGILALLRPHESLRRAYAAVAVLNSAFGLAAYNEISKSADLSTTHLENIKIAHQEATEEDMNRVAGLSYQISILYEAEKRCGRSFFEQEECLSKSLNIAVSILLKVEEGQPEKMVESVRSLNPWGIPKGQLNLFDTSQELLASPAKIKLLSTSERRRLKVLQRRLEKDTISQEERMELADLGKIAIYEERLNAEPPSEFRIGISPESDNGNKSQKESNGTEEFSHWTKRIFCIPGVCGGKPCIAGTRIPVWVLEHFRRSGASDAEILKAYPSLTAGDLVAAWQYAHIHEKEINTQIKQNRGE